MAQQNIEYVQDHSLELDEDIQGFKRGLLPQRIGRTVMLILFVVAALGLFGTGPLSHTTQNATSTQVRYEKFLRFENQTAVEMKVLSADGATKVTFPQSYLNDLNVEKIQPEPASTRIINDATIYTFLQLEDGEILFLISPEKAGTIEGKVMVNNDAIQLSHFVYP